MIGTGAGGGQGELLHRESFAVLAENGAEVSCLPKKWLRERGAAGQIADHSAFGEHPIGPSRHKAALRNAADQDAVRFPMSRSTQEYVPWNQSHCTPGNGLHHDWRGVRRQPEGAYVSFETGRFDTSQRARQPHPPQRRRHLDARRKRLTATVTRTHAVGFTQELARFL